MSASSRLDVVVAGAGPAGLALATALARRGLRVACMGPEARWHPRFGCWEGELPDEWAGAPGVVRTRYADAGFVGAHVEFRGLGRPYLRLDTDALQQSLAAAAAQAGVLRPLPVVEQLAGAPGAWALTGSGIQLQAAVVVDCTGGGLGALARGPGPAPAVQAAWGDVFRLPVGHPYGRMALMDWRPAAAASDDEIGDLDRDPSFLYVLPLDSAHVFLEETSLARRPALPLPLLEARLRRRLVGLEAVACGQVERCFIPMGGPRPVLGQPLLAFGAAGGLVHPATGYQLARSLQLANPVAASIADGLAHDPTAAIDAAWRQVWPRSRQRSWALFDYGLEVLLQLDRSGIERFFSLFFDLPPDDWRGFLSGDSPPELLRTTMLRMFWRADMRTRWALLGADSGARWAPMLGAAFG